ncbi:MAG: DUF975 family protein [Clostridia bacterium]|nr:DUF975 family protein [Clostridia bacterium]
MSENKRIRQKALDSLEHRLFGSVWVSLVVCSVIYSLIVGLPSSVSSLTSRLVPVVGALIGFPLMLVSAVISGPMTYGFTRVFLKVARGDKRIDIAEMFSGFREEIGESFLLGLLRSIFVFLWSLLLIVPGIVKAYAYSMAFYIQQEAKDKNWRVCLDESAALMDGYKGKLFLLDLSFIGWYIVGLLCFGVGMLWVSVYHAEARAHFYEELKREKLGRDTYDETESTRYGYEPVKNDPSDDVVFEEERAYVERDTVKSVDPFREDDKKKGD